MTILFENIFIIYFVSTLYLISKKLALIFLKDDKIESTILLYIFILISASYVIFLLIISGLYSNNFIYSLTLLSFISSLFCLTDIKKFKLKEFYNDNLFLLFLPFFIISLFPASDPDSLDYHLGAAKFWIENEKNLPIDHWLHFRLASYGETLNIFSVLIFDGKLLSFLKVFILFVLTKLIFNYFKKKRNYNIFLFSLLSSPILIHFISNQKPQFLGYLILILFFLLLILKKKKYYSSILLAYVSSLKFSFVPLVAILFIFALNSKNFNNKKFIISFIIFLIIFWLPLTLKNFVFYSNPLSPFFESILSNTPDQTVINFSDMLKNYSEYGFSKFHEFINILIPLNLGAITTYFGVSIILYSIIKKFNKHSKLFVYLSLIIFLSYILIGQYSSRYLYFSYFLLIFSSLFMEIRFKNFFFKILSLQTIAIYFFLVSYSILNIFSLLNLNSYENYLTDKAYQYEETNWLKKNIVNENYTSDIRSKYFLNKNHFPLEFIYYTPSDSIEKNLFNFLKKNKIEKVSLLVDDNFVYKIFQFCKKNSTSKNFKVLRRNFLVKEKTIKREIFEIDLNNSKCEIKL